MWENYRIEGMTCGACVAKVQKALSSLDGVKLAKIQLDNPQAQLQLKEPLTISILQQAIGDYKISRLEETNSLEPNRVMVKGFWSTYRPLLLIIAFITGTTLLAQYPFEQFSAMLWMRYFMAGFFLVFSFFKLLDLEGFANSYRQYDIVAKLWPAWAYIYPFVELALGIAYLIHFAPVLTNCLTLIILGVSSIGVIQSNLKKEQIRCACLGAVFNLPMSTVTIIEDLAMVLMAAMMLGVA